MFKLDAVGLFVNDMEKTVTFYRDVMGMRTEWNAEPNAELFLGDARMILYGRKDFELMTSRAYDYPQGLNGTVELSFSVENFSAVDQEYARVVAAGAAPVFAPTNMPWGHRTSYVGDPDGNLIEISSFQP